MSFHKQWDLKPRILKVSGLGWDRARWPWREDRQTTQQTVWKQPSEERLGHPEGRLFTLLGEESIPERQRSQRYFSKNKEAGQHHFTVLPFSINTEPPRLGGGGTAQC